MRPIVHAQNPELSTGKVSQLLSEDWKNMEQVITFLHFILWWFYLSISFIFVSLFYLIVWFFALKFFFFFLNNEIDVFYFI